MKARKKKKKRKSALLTHHIVLIAGRTRIGIGGVIIVRTPFSPGAQVQYLLRSETLSFVNSLLGCVATWNEWHRIPRMGLAYLSVGARWTGRQTWSLGDVFSSFRCDPMETSFRFISLYLQQGCATAAFYSLSPLSLVVDYKDDAVRKYSIDLFLSVPERNCFITSFCLSLPPHSTYRPGLHLNVSCPIFSFFPFFFFFCFLPDGLRAREWPTPDVVEW